MFTNLSKGLDDFEGSNIFSFFSSSGSDFLENILESSLLGSVVFYASLSSFFLGIFLIKYRVEYLLIFPFISLLFTYYFILGLKPDSPVQYPERLYLENKLGLCVILVFTAFVLLTFFDLPIIHFLLEKNDFIH